MQHCEKCGSELPTDARFCGRCGQSIDVDSETDETTNSGDAPSGDAPKVAIPLSPPDTPMDETDVEGAPPHHAEGAIDLAPTDGESLRSPGIDDDSTVVTPPHAEGAINLAPTGAAPGIDGASPVESTALSASQDPASENDEEEEQQRQDHDLESTNPLPRDLDAEPREPASPLLDEHPQHDPTPSGKLEALSLPGPAPRQGLRSIPRLLLILLTVLIVAVGGVAALIGLSNGNFPGSGGASNALSSASISGTVTTTGPSLNASVCAGSSTPSTSGTSGGVGLTLSPTSGCSSFVAATATSLCLIFPYNPGAFHRYILDVSNATVDSVAYHLVLSIAEYTGPATYNDAVHVTAGIGEGSTGRNISWVYRSGNVSINSDEQSGTMDVILESSSGGNIIHVVGGWTCGRLIKNS